jgi:four helix bundle protein
MSYAAARSLQYSRGMNTKANEMADRLKRFATRVVKFARAMPSDESSRAIAKQLTKSGTGEAANYHAARRGKSRDDFIAKLATAAEEADETENWFKIITDAKLISTASGQNELFWLADESRQLRAILVASLRTARANNEKLKAANKILKSNRKSHP